MSEGAATPIEPGLIAWIRDYFADPDRRLQTFLSRPPRGRDDQEDTINAEPEPGSPQFEPLGALEFEPTTCPVCGATEVGRALHKTVQGVEMHYGVCTNCATLYTNPRLTVDSLRTLYDSEEFFEGGENNLNYYSFLSGEKYLRRTARGRIERFRPYAPGKRLLEVASAAGFFLAEAKAAGFDAEGVEFSGPMAAYAAEALGGAGDRRLDRGDRPRRRETYDVIASWGVMTILRDPKAVMAKFHRALKPGGVWAFNTYDNHSLWGRMFGSQWYILVPNTSQIHNDTTLRRLIDEAGLRPRRRAPRPPVRERRAAALRAALARRPRRARHSSSSGSTS